MNRQHKIPVHPFVLLLFIAHLLFAKTALIYDLSLNQIVKGHAWRLNFLLYFFQLFIQKIAAAYLSICLPA